MRAMRPTLTLAVTATALAVAGWAANALEHVMATTADKAFARGVHRGLSEQERVGGTVRQIRRR